MESEWKADDVESEHCSVCLLQMEHRRGVWLCKLCDLIGAYSWWRRFPVS